MLTEAECNFSPRSLKKFAESMHERATTIELDSWVSSLDHVATGMRESTHSGSLTDSAHVRQEKCSSFACLACSTIRWPHLAWWMPPSSAAYTVTISAETEASIFVALLATHLVTRERTFAVQRRMARHEVGREEPACRPFGACHVEVAPSTPAAGRHSDRTRSRIRNHST